jgi:hypothetical protein
MFYLILDHLAARLGGPWRLRDYPDSSGCPPHGVYFFFEDGENRADGSMRVVRVGTYALTATSKATLWPRLRQHRGQLTGPDPGGGNHRASVFRRHVGAVLIRRDGRPDELLRSWLARHRPPSERTAHETRTEREASSHIGAMPFLWLNVPSRTDRGYLESSSIALLSRAAGGPDPAFRGRRSRHQPELQGGQEIRPIRCLDQLPCKGLERDVLTDAELTQQIRYPSSGQAGSDPAEQVGGDQADLLGDEVENGQAHHHVPVIDGTDSLTDRIRQERIAKPRRRAPALSAPV